MADATQATLALGDALSTIERSARCAYDAVGARNAVDICYSSLLAIAENHSDCAVTEVVRAAALFASTNRVSPSLNTRDVTTIREAAGAAIGLLSPDALFPLWAALGGPDSAARHNLLPVLDYIRSPLAVPYLTRLLTRCADWPDGELTAWFIVRTLERVGGRSALNSLRSFAAHWDAFSVETDDCSRRQLRIEVARVIEALDRRAIRRDNRSLLRPAREGSELLLRSQPEDDPLSDADRSELVRAEHKDSLDIVHRAT